MTKTIESLVQRGKKMARTAIAPILLAGALVGNNANASGINIAGIVKYSIDTVTNVSGSITRLKHEVGSLEGMNGDGNDTLFNSGLNPSRIDMYSVNVNNNITNHLSTDSRPTNSISTFNVIIEGTGLPTNSPISRTLNVVYDNSTRGFNNGGNLSVKVTDKSNNSVVANFNPAIANSYNNLIGVPSTIVTNNIPLANIVNGLSYEVKLSFVDPATITSISKQGTNMNLSFKGSPGYTHTPRIGTNMTDHSSWQELTNYSVSIPFNDSTNLLVSTNVVVPDNGFNPVFYDIKSE